MADLLTIERTLAREIAPAVERAVPGVEVLALELASPKRFCVYVDHPEGVDHELCARVTRVLDDYRRDYTIDVSSPGSERPLRKPQHFLAAVGRRVQIRTSAGVAGRKRFSGEIVSAGDLSVSIAVGNESLDIPYEAIVRGNVIDKE